ncbi:type II secretion system F family protein [Lacunimicrobium album]
MFWFVFLTVLMIAVIAVGVWKAISGRRLSTLWIMETAIRNDLPLDEVIEGHAYEFRGKRGRRLLGLSRALREGEDLSHAISRRPYRNLVPEEGRLAINVGSESGTLSPAVQDALALATIRFERNRQQHTFSIVYLSMIISVIFLQTSFVLVFIVPKLKLIFEDMGIELPKTTSSFIDLGNAFALYGPLWILVGFIAIVDLVRRYFWRRKRGIAMYGFLHWLNPQIFTVDILRTLAVTAIEGKPLLPTIEALARHHNDSTIRYKLRRVITDSHQGESIWDALHRVKLIDTWQTGVLKTAEPTSLLGDSLKRLAEELDIAQDHRRQIVREAVRPMVIVGLGVFVLWTALSFFTPLVKLIGDLG